jgi:hypothetical protein
MHPVNAPLKTLSRLFAASPGAEARGVSGGVALHTLSSRNRLRWPAVALASLCLALAAALAISQLPADATGRIASSHSAQTVAA